MAGVMETPVVVHLSQRPGPATGIATKNRGKRISNLRCTQGGEPTGDLRAGSIESAFSLTQEAFRVALKYQTPAIVLTDQYFVNSF